MDMEHEIKKAESRLLKDKIRSMDAAEFIDPSAQQAAGIIADDPQYKRMLWNVAQDWTRTDRHIALACYIERWADSRAAATPAQPIAPQLNEPTAELVERLTDYAANPGYSHNDYADTMKQAASCIG